MAKKNKIPEWEYLAQRSSDQKLIDGTLQAPDQASVTEALVQRGLVPINIEPAGGTGLDKDLSFGNFGQTVKKKDLMVWARNFSIMIDAGLPVIRALTILSEQTEKESLRDITAEIKTDIENGNNLGESMEVHIEVFGDLIVNMVKAAEVGGFLDGALRQIAEDLEADVKLRAKVKSAMTYPVVILVMALLMATGMLLFIVPVFAEMFENMGGELPMPTQIMMNISEFLKVGGIPMVVVLGLAFMWWQKHKRDMAIREFLDPKKLKLPVFGKLIQKITIARFARNFGTLLNSDVPIVKSLDIVGGTVGNRVIEKALDDVKKSVSQGNQMSKPLEQYPVFPPMVVAMLAVGEEGGAIPEMLAKIAKDYDQQVETTTEQLASLIEPIMIVFLGALVGSMVVALYLPIFSIYDLINQ